METRVFGRTGMQLSVLASAAVPSADSWCAAIHSNRNAPSRG